VRATAFSTNYPTLDEYERVGPQPDPVRHILRIARDHTRHRRLRPVHRHDLNGNDAAVTAVALGLLLADLPEYSTGLAIRGLARCRAVSITLTGQQT
jgi:hypothetical protein